MANWPVLQNNVDLADATQQNLLQTEKQDRDGQIPATGVQQWKKGADVASAAALPLGNDGNYFDVTGVVGITSIVQTAVGGAAVQAGTVIKLHFDGTPLLTHSANLYLPGAENHTALVGEEMEFTCFGANQWRCTAIGTSYREGTWTVTRNSFTENIGGGSITNAGYYTKKGREVTLTATITCAGGATIAATAGVSYLSGMPFAPAVKVPGIWANTGTCTEGGFVTLASGALLYISTSWGATQYAISITVVYFVS